MSKEKLKSSSRRSLALSYKLYARSKLLIQSKIWKKSPYASTVEAKLGAAKFDFDEIPEQALAETSAINYSGQNRTPGGATTAATAAVSSTEFKEETFGYVKDQKSAAQKQSELAEVLSDQELMWTTYFSGMLDNCIDVVEENLEEGKFKLVGSSEQQNGKQRMEKRLARACDLPIKLILTPLHHGGKAVKKFADLLDMKFGALHASLRVGHVILEWSDNSLVTPYLCDYVERLIQVSLESYGKWTESVSQQHGQFMKTAEELDFSGEVEQVYVIASKKKEMIDRLIEVVVQYNRFGFYNVIDRNCQDFVMDCLKALGVEIPKGLKGDLRDYYKTLEKGRSPSIPNFKNHDDLNKYASDCNVSSLTPHDLEYLLAMYFRFHLEFKTKEACSRKELEEWVCPRQPCHMDRVDVVEHGDLLIHSFLH